jgi:hypothetical protein
MWWNYYILMVKLFQEWGEEGIKENDGGSKFN